MKMHFLLHLLNLLYLFFPSTPRPSLDYEEVPAPVSHPSHDHISSVSQPHADLLESRHHHFGQKIILVLLFLNILRQLNVNTDCPNSLHILTFQPPIKPF